LVEIILKDVAGAPGELPLIEHALLELYERRSGNQLTQAAYEEIGGISGALAKRAEAEFIRLTPAQQEILRKMFVLRLIQPGEGTEDTRRRATKEELLAAGGNAKEAEAVLQQWTNARLLTTTRDEEKKQEIVDVAHETLIRTWPKVQDWLKDERENSRLLGMMRHATQEWQRSGKSTDYLWVGAQLAHAEELYTTHAEDLTAAEKEFIKEGTAWRDHEAQAAEAQRQKELETAQRLAQGRSRTLKLLWGIATVILIALGITTFLARSWQKARDESNQRRVRFYWETGRQERDEGNLLLALHFMAEAGRIAPTQNAAAVFIQDMSADLQQIALKNILPHEKSVLGAVFDQAQEHILTWSADSTARLWEAESGNPIGQPMKHEDTVNGAVFDQAQKHILTWSRDGTARLWEAESGRSIGQAMKHEGPINGAVFDQVQKRILTWSRDGTARLWEAESGNPIGQPMKHEYIVNGAVFDQAQKRILTWGGDGTARLWQAESGNPIGQPMKHEKGVLGAVFDQTQTRILTWSGSTLGESGTARLWEAESGNPIGQPMKHEGPVNGAVFDQAQKRIMTWSDDGTARLWDIPGDLDFPHEHLVLQVQALTGTKLDPQSSQISVIPTLEWQALQKQYFAIAREHAKSCQYKRQNVYLRFFSTDEK